MFSAQTAVTSLLLFSEESQSQGNVQEGRHQGRHQYRLWARAVGSPLAGKWVQERMKICASQAHPPKHPNHIAGS